LLTLFFSITIRTLWDSKHMLSGLHKGLGGPLKEGSCTSVGHCQMARLRSVGAVCSRAEKTRKWGLLAKE